MTVIMFPRATQSADHHGDHARSRHGCRRRWRGHSPRRKPEHRVENQVTHIGFAGSHVFSFAFEVNGDFADYDFGEAFFLLRSLMVSEPSSGSYCCAERVDHLQVFGEFIIEKVRVKTPTFSGIAPVWTSRVRRSTRLLLRCGSGRRCGRRTFDFKGADGGSSDSSSIPRCASMMMSRLLHGRQLLLSPFRRVDE